MAVDKKPGPGGLQDDDPTTAAALGNGDTRRAPGNGDTRRGRTPGNGDTR